MSIAGCAHARCDDGSVWTHGYCLTSGSESLLLCSPPDVGSTVVLEGGPGGADVSLRALAASAGAADAEAHSAPVRITSYADAVAAGQATVVPQARHAPAVPCVWPALSRPDEQDWRDACNGIATQAASGSRVCVVVCGPKGAGKSTLTRLLVNTLLSATQHAVGLLDADCGAPEVTPPGLVSLSGPLPSRS